MEKLQNLIQEIEFEKLNEGKKEPCHYWLLNHYDVLNVQGQDKLIIPLSDTSQDIKYYCANEDMFEILYDVHSSIGHGGRDHVLKEVGTKYKNIMKEDIQTFLNFCEPCQRKRKGTKKEIVVKPIISSELNSRCQVDLIDYQSQSNGVYKYVFVYQDHLTKFVILRPLTSKTAEEVSA